MSPKMHPKGFGTFERRVPDFQTGRDFETTQRTSHLKTMHPPIRALVGDCGNVHHIYTSFWFPGRRGIRLNSWSSTNETTSTIKIF